MVINLGGILHVVIDVFFRALIVALFIRVILSWLPIPPANRFVRFFTGLTDPLIMPLASRIPSGSIGFLSLNITIALLFDWWALQLLDGLILSALPPTW